MNYLCFQAVVKNAIKNISTDVKNDVCRRNIYFYTFFNNQIANPGNDVILSPQRGEYEIF